MKPKWMSFKALMKVKKKHKSWKCFMSSKSGSDYKEYTKARNQAKNEIQNSIKLYEKALAKEVMKSPKKFWSHMKSKSKRNNSIPQLQKDNGRNTENNLTMNDYICSVFTRVQGKPPTPERQGYAASLQNIDS